MTTEPDDAALPGRVRDRLTADEQALVAPIEERLAAHGADPSSALTPEETRAESRRLLRSPDRPTKSRP